MKKGFLILMLGIFSPSGTIFSQEQDISSTNAPDVGMPIVLDSRKEEKKAFIDSLNHADTKEEKPTHEEKEHPRPLIERASKPWEGA